MSEKVDRLALRAVLTLLALLVALIVLRDLAVEIALQAPGYFGEEEPVRKAAVTSPKKVASAATKRPQTPRPLSGGTRSRKEAVSPPARVDEPVGKPLPPITIPTPAPPRRLVIPVTPRSWSRLVEIPQGYGGTVTFTLGRIRVERNGVDIGTVYRKRSIQGQVVDGQPVVTDVDLGAFFDKTPRTLEIDPGTRTLRFRSEERTSGEVVVVFSN